MGSGADRPSAVARRTTREWWKEAGEGQRNEAPLAAQGLHPCLGKAWRARHGEAMDCHNLVERAKQLKNVNEHKCQIYGDTVGFLATGDIFLRATNVPSLCVGHAMSMSAKRGINVVLNAKLDTRGTKEALKFGEMRRMELIWTMN